MLTQGYPRRQVGAMLFVDEETIGRWGRGYQAQELGGLKNHPRWGGEHGQRWLLGAELA